MPPRHPGSAAALLIGGYFELDWVSPDVEDVSVDVVVEDEVVELELELVPELVDVDELESVGSELSPASPKPRISVGDQVVISLLSFVWMSSSMPAIVHVKFTRPFAEVDFLQMNVMNDSRSPVGFRNPKSEERSIVPSDALCTWTW